MFSQSKKPGCYSELMKSRHLSAHLADNSSVRLFRLNFASSLRSVNTSCMYPCGMTFESSKYSLSIPLFIFCPGSESCGISSDRDSCFYMKMWETSLFAELPLIHHPAAQNNLFVIPLTPKRSEKDVLQARGFWIVREERRKTASGRRGGKKTRWSELRSRDCLWKRAVSSKWSARGREKKQPKKQPLRFVSPCTSSEFISSLFVFITVGAKVKDVRSITCTGDINSVRSEAPVHNFIMACVE